MVNPNCKRFASRIESLFIDEYLVGLGVDAKRISTISYGKVAPLDPASNEGAWAKNRRAVFVPQ